MTNLLSCGIIQKNKKEGFIIRCWHKSLIPYLPRQQLLGQWRECCCIAKNIKEKGTPNHILVNKIMDYLIEHFYTYGCLVYNEMVRRRYITSFYKFGNYFEPYTDFINYGNIFSEWHNDRYLIQCMFNLEEKYDCQGVTDEEWNMLLKGYEQITGEKWNDIFRQCSNNIS